MKIGCVLLAAGSGKRFGGDKLTCVIDGVSLAERACKLHAQIGYDARVLVSRPADSFLSALTLQYGFTLAENERASQGIGTSAAKGIATLLALEPSLDGALFAVCDQPYLTQATIARLLSTFADKPDAIVAPFYKGKRGNPVVFPRALFPEFLALDGDVGGSAILRAHPELLLSIAADDPLEFFDIDTKMDESRIPYADHSKG